MTSRLSKTGSTQRKQLQLLQRQQALVQQSLALEPQTPWFKLKGWFLHSETILIARATALVGFVTAAVGAFDWSPLLGLDVSTGFNQRQVVWLGGIMAVQGVAVELGRRRNMAVST